MVTLASNKTITALTALSQKKDVPVIEPIKVTLFNYKYTPNKLQDLPVVNKKNHSRLSKTNNTSTLIRKPTSTSHRTTIASDNLILKRNKRVKEDSNGVVQSFDRTKVRALISKLFALNTTGLKIENTSTSKTQNIRDNLRQQIQDLKRSRSVLHSMSDVEKALHDFDISVNNELLARIENATDLDSKTESEATSWLALERLRIIKDKTKQIQNDNIVSTEQLIEHVKTFKDSMMLEAYVSHINATKAEVIDKVQKSDDVYVKTNAEIENLKGQLRQQQIDHDKKISNLENSIRDQNELIQRKELEATEYVSKFEALKNQVEQDSKKVELKRDLQIELQVDVILDAVERLSDDDKAKLFNKIDNIHNLTSEAEIKSLKVKLGELQEQKVSLTTQLAHTVASLSEIDRKLTLATDENNRLLKKITILADDNRSLSTETKQNSEKIKHLEERIAKNISTARKTEQELESATVTNNKLLEEIAVLTADNELLIADNESLSTETEQNSGDITHLNERILDLNSQLQNNKGLKQALRNSAKEIETLQSQIRHLTAQRNADAAAIKNQSEKIKTLEEKAEKFNKEKQDALQDLMTNVLESLTKNSIKKTLITNVSLVQAIERVRSDSHKLIELNERTEKFNIDKLRIDADVKRLQQQNDDLKKKLKIADDFRKQMFAYLNVQTTEDALKNVELAVNAYNEDAKELGMMKLRTPNLMQKQDEKQMEMLRLGRKNMWTILDNFLIANSDSNNFGAYLEQLGGNSIKQELIERALQQDDEDLARGVEPSGEYYYGDTSKRNYEIYSRVGASLLGETEEGVTSLNKMNVLVSLSDYGDNKFNR